LALLSLIDQRRCTIKIFDKNCISCLAKKLLFFRSTNHKPGDWERCGWHQFGRNQGVCQGVQVEAVVAGIDADPSWAGPERHGRSGVQPERNMQVNKTV